MASKSPGKDKSKNMDNKSDAGSVGSTGKSSGIAGFLGSVFRSRKSKSKERKKESGESRVEVAYHGKRADARDRSSEDPKRHTIPRAVVPKGDQLTSDDDKTPVTPSRSKSKLRKKSLEREMERRALREMELERGKRLRERSRSRERLQGLSATEQVTPSIKPSSSTQDLVQAQLAQKSVVQRSSSSVGATSNVISTSVVERHSSFRVERSFQLRRTGPEMPPPIPPPRNKSMRSPTKDHSTPDAGAGPSTPKTPFQFWREQRLRSEEMKVQSSPSGGAVPKRAEKVEKAEDILARWKQERAKRVRNASGASGVSNASSTTAEPVKKVSVRHFATPEPKPATVHISEDEMETDSTPKRSKERKSSALSAFFHTFKTKKSNKENKEEPRKYSVTALMTSTPLSKGFHDTVLHASEPGKDEPVSPQPIHGTVLHPLPPRSSTTRTPFEEWRRYRSGQDPPPRPRDTASPSGIDPRRFAAPMHHGATSEPEADNVSIGSSMSSKSSTYGRAHHHHQTDSSHDDLHRLVGPQYYSTGRSASAMGIPRFIHRPRNPSLVSASPRLERPQGMMAYEGGFHASHGARLAHGSSFGSTQSHVWYHEYSHDAFPHDSEFEEGAFAAHNYDGRINLIRGRVNCIVVKSSHIV